MACQVTAEIHNGGVAPSQKSFAQCFGWRDAFGAPVQELRAVGCHLNNTGRRHGRPEQPWLQALGDSEPLLLSGCRGRSSGKYRRTCRTSDGLYELTTIQYSAPCRQSESVGPWRGTGILLRSHTLNVIRHRTDRRLRDIKVRRFAQMPANRENPGVHHTARQSRDREGALANSVAGMRSRPRGHPVAARIGASWRPAVRTSGSAPVSAAELWIGVG